MRRRRHSRRAGKRKNTCRKTLKLKSLRYKRNKKLRRRRWLNMFVRAAKLFLFR